MCEYYNALQHTRELAEFYNIKEDESKEEEDPIKVNINELKGFIEVRRPILNDCALKYSIPTKTTKLNIGTSKNPKLVVIGDYRD